MNIWQAITDINNSYGSGDVQSITFLSENAGYVIMKLQYGYETRVFTIELGKYLHFRGHQRRLK